MTPPQSRHRERGERVPAHAHVPHAANADVCQLCGLAASDRAHIRPARPETNGHETGRDSSGRFVKGGKPGPGRKTGSKDLVAREVREFCQRVITDPLYRHNVFLRARAGMLAPAMEVTLYHYAIGKPKETVALEGQDRMPFQLVLLGPRRDPLAAPATAEVPPAEMKQLSAGRGRSSTWRRPAPQALP